uniref:Oxidoreductase n=1 Tax=Brugia timori TaxID=42155 RepID=A0A0R3QEH9_9BILA
LHHQMFIECHSHILEEVDEEDPIVTVVVDSVVVAKDRRKMTKQADIWSD